MLRLTALLPFLALSVSANAAPPEDIVVGSAKRVCRPAAPRLGSRIKRAKVCRTATEWEETDRAARGADITVKAPQPEPWERTRPQ
jgi:hypothetical protein